MAWGHTFLAKASYGYHGHYGIKSGAQLHSLLWSMDFLPLQFHSDKVGQGIDAPHGDYSFQLAVFNCT